MQRKFPTDKRENIICLLPPWTVANADCGMYVDQDVLLYHGKDCCRYMSIVNDLYP